MVSRYGSKQTIAIHNKIIFLALILSPLKFEEDLYTWKCHIRGRNLHLYIFSEKSAVTQFFSPADFKMLKNLKKKEKWKWRTLRAKTWSLNKIQLVTIDF